MPALADNNVFISVDGVQVQSFFKTVSLSPSNKTVDTTRGANTAHMQRAPGLNDTSITMKLGYDTTSVQSFIQKLRPGQTVQIDYGPEGAVSGKPRHTQQFVITGAGHTVSVTKEEVVFDISGEAADAPIADIFAGAVFP
jgi:hypothetical protein